METWQKIKRDYGTTKVWDKSFQGNKALVRPKDGDNVEKLEALLPRFCPYLEIVERRKDGLIVRDTEKN